MRRGIAGCALRRGLGRAVFASIALVLLAAPNQSGASESRSIRFQHISQDQGLSQSYVYTIVQDQAGYMWFGTQDGLNRFDGFEFTVFAHDPNDPQSLSDESIRTMIIDRYGILWIGTDAGGLSRFDSADQAFTNYLHDPTDSTSISDNRVRVVYEDSSGALWIGTDGSGLDRFDRESETFVHYASDPSDPGSLASNHVWSILEDSDNILWVATDDGLSRFDPQTDSFTRYQHDVDDPTSISDDRLRVLYEDRDNALWIGTENGGLNRFDRDNESFEHFAHDPNDATSISANRINTIYQDGAGVLWIGTVHGLNAWNPNTQSFERYFNDHGDRYSLSHDNVLSIYQDRGDVLWIGTYGGLSRWTPATRAMLHYRINSDDPQSLNENAISSFAEDRAGNIWVGTFGGGLNVLDRSTDRFRRLKHAADDDTSLSSDRVMAVTVDSDGVLWAGTRAAGLNRYDAEAGSFTRYRHDPEDPTSISSDGVTYILEDSNKRLWIGTFGGGLNAFDPETQQFRRFRSDPDNPLALSNDRVLVLFEDSAGSVWIGTYGGGLNRFDPTTGIFTHYRGEPGRRDGLGGDEITMIQEGSRGDLWIGVKDSGLHRWRRSDRELGEANFQRLTELDGLPNATIYSGVWDHAGYLWLSTGRGLSRLDTESLEFRNFDTSHGLQGDEFNLAAGYGAADGQLFFGGVNGFNAFQPTSLGGARKPPQVVITDFLSLNKSVDLSDVNASGERAQFKHDQDVIGFEFAAMDYAAPEKNRYMYRLDGFDQDWVDAESNRRVTYTNLPAGEYTFRVRASNNDGVWSEQDAVLDFYMIPAPWATWWAYLIYATILATLVLAALRHHTRRVQQDAKLKYAENLALTHDRMNEAQRIANIGNWDWNPVTNELWWSDETYHLFGMNPRIHSVTFESFLERVHGDDLEAVRQAIGGALNGRRPFAIDHRIVRLDGNDRVVHGRAEVVLNDEGQAIRMAGTVQDITERKKTENEIRRRADYQQLLAELSANLVMVQPEEFARQIDRCLETIGISYGLDAIDIWSFADAEEKFRLSNQWVRIGGESRQGNQGWGDSPWITEQLLAGELVVVDDVEQMPLPAAAEQVIFMRRGTKSFLIVPLLIEENLEAGCVFSTIQEKCAWSAETIAELRLVAENLLGAISRSRAEARITKLREENVCLREHVSLTHGFDEVVGDDPKLKECLAAVEKVAPTDVAVLILGETGTGKELIARAIHKLSPRCDRALVKVNCPALPAELIESELFGHEKGAFTGAHSGRLGRFELADGGTIFLDEIGELPVPLQSKLLRVLQTGEFERLGGTETLRCDVRVIAATNRDLVRAIAQGEFRTDLYYRMSSFPIRLPALRNRRKDIPLLAEHFVRKHAGHLDKNIDAISAKMIKEFMSYSWPGNVRELESIIERALISAKNSSVLELPSPLQSITGTNQTKTRELTDEGPELDAVERSHIIHVLEQSGWKISGAGGAAAVLGIPPSTLRSKMKRLGVTR